MDKPQNVTELLLGWGAGDKEALNDLNPPAHDELHRYMRNGNVTTRCKLWRY